MNFNQNIKNFFDASLCLTNNIRVIIDLLPNEIKSCAQEIRLRVNKSICIVCPNKSYFLAPDGSAAEFCTPLFVTPMDINNIFKSICNYSMYAHQEQIKNGYITFRGGHRAGICGTAIISNNEIVNLRDISSINIRIAREKKSSANEIIHKLGKNIGKTLIAGPPSSGKTTLLRDIARQLSYDNKVCVIDERGEIGCVYRGIPQCDIGLCDILNGYPKGKGILQAVRALSPDIIICDEIGSENDAISIEESLNSGVDIIASMHAANLNELMNRKQAQRLLNTGAFNKIVMLQDRSSPCKINNIYKVDESDAKINRINNSVNSGNS